MKKLFLLASLMAPIICYAMEECYDFEYSLEGDYESLEGNYADNPNYDNQPSISYKQQNLTATQWNELLFELPQTPDSFAFSLQDQMPNNASEDYLIDENKAPEGLETFTNDIPPLELTDIITPHITNSLENNTQSNSKKRSNSNNTINNRSKRQKRINTSTKNNNDQDTIYQDVNDELLAQIKLRSYSVICSEKHKSTMGSMDSIRRFHSHTTVDTENFDKYESLFTKDLQAFCPLCARIFPQNTFYTLIEIRNYLHRHYSTKHKGQKLHDFDNNPQTYIRFIENSSQTNSESIAITDQEYTAPQLQDLNNTLLNCTNNTINKITYEELTDAQLHKIRNKKFTLQCSLGHISTMKSLYDLKKNHGHNTEDIQKIQEMKNTLDYKILPFCILCKKICRSTINYDELRQVRMSLEKHYKYKHNGNFLKNDFTQNPKPYMRILKNG